MTMKRDKKIIKIIIMIGKLPLKKISLEAK